MVVLEGWIVVDRGAAYQARLVRNPHLHYSPACRELSFNRLAWLELDTHPRTRSDSDALSFGATLSPLMAVGHRGLSAAASSEEADIVSELLRHFDCVRGRPNTLGCIGDLVRNAGVENGLLAASVREGFGGHHHRL